MTAALVLALLFAPAATREPVGGAEAEHDPLARRVGSLLAGEAIATGTASIVPLYARVPSEAGHGRPPELTAGSKALRARFLEEDGRGYLRVQNPGKGPVFLAAGTVFAGGGVEAAAARDAVIPPEYAALVPAAALRGGGGADLEPAGALPPHATAALVAGLPAFLPEMRSFVLRGDDRYTALMASGPVRARRDALMALVKPMTGGFGGTMVGAVLVVGDRPVAVRIFARHDLFLEALPDMILGFAVAVRDEQLGAPDASHIAPVEARSRALGWLRAVVRTRGAWTESYGAGFETVFTTAMPSAAVHAIADHQHSLVHAGFYSIRESPQAQLGEPSVPPPPPDTPDETPTGFRERRPRPTVEDERRSDQNPNPGPHGDPSRGAGGAQTPDRGTPPR